MINLELSSASKMTKYVTTDFKELISRTKQALDVYTKLNTFIEGYLKYKKIEKLEDLENEQML